jgi:hypothetical protein
MKVTLELLKNRLADDDGVWPWVDPQSVEGFDREAAFLAAKMNWFRISNRPDLTESAVEVIPDYLNFVLSQASRVKGQLIPGARFLDAVIWLIQNLGSSYACSTLAVWRTLVREIEPQAAISPVMRAFEQSSEAFVRDILRNMLREYFDVGGLFPGWQTRLEGQVEAELLASLEALVHGGYETIDNTDARYFSDGRPRFGNSITR